jgi:hypothetical protein
MEPTFPLRIVPNCRHCGEPCTRQITSPSNLNGNANRPYYVCMNDEHYRKFSTFDDSRGIIKGNPQCWCRYTSRRGKKNGTNGSEFYSCPVGGCGWFKGVPATTARPAVGSNGIWSGETRYNWSGETMPSVETGANWSRETTPETHTFVFSAGCSYAEDSPVPEVATVKVVAPRDYVARTAPETSTTPAVFNVGHRHEAQTQSDLEAHTIGTEIKPTYRKRRRNCCLMM